MKKYLCLSIFVFLGFVSISLFAQDEYIYGKAVDKDDKPLPYVHVINRRVGNFTITDSLGNYRLYISAGRMSLVEFLRVGNEAQVEEFYLRKGDKREINVTFFNVMDISTNCNPPKNPYYTRRRYNPQILESSLPSMIIEITEIKDYRLLVDRK